MSNQYKFEGWLGYDEMSAKGNMRWGDFEPKSWSENDVDIKISHCGVCGSDTHTLKSGWGPTPYRTGKLHVMSAKTSGLACCVGHEIIGKAVRVGNNVNHIKIGDRVGVGAQSDSCGECVECENGKETHCLNATNTYGDIYKDNSGKSYGGYANYNRAPGRFVFRIPDELDSAEAAPMLCGGVTVYSPLKQNGCGPGKNVGIVGVGGLGHFGVLFAKALGADEVVGISRKASKKTEVLKLGADRYIATDDDNDWAEVNKRSLDLIVSTVSSGKMPLDGYLSLLKTKGTLIQVGLPDAGELPNVNAFTLVANGIKIGGSAMGAPHEIVEMLKLAVEKDIHPWIEKRSMRDANKVIVDLDEGRARYRYVLVNDE
ncbi:putative zinc-binding alcohol dehydrogenase [Aureobasidium sp. EXF-8845]|nr:putative zinc-binding alcohol dehydrogenase [Aureobasidium sp. EXF-8845]KAI4852768.1 putative zinc-binding alcohol dehydrogenase [Aureobasidium sp. EXF-8846]